MDRRNFFKACVGGIAGVVLLPLRAIQGKAPAIGGLLLPEPYSQAIFNGSIEPTPADLQDISEECQQFIDNVHNSPTRTYNLIPTKPTPMEDGDHKQAFVDWAKDIRDESAREYLRQRHKI